MKVVNKIKILGESEITDVPIEIMQDIESYDCGSGDEFYGFK